MSSTPPSTGVNKILIERKLSISQEEKELSGALAQLKNIYGDSKTLKPVSSNGSNQNNYMKGAGSATIK